MGESITFWVLAVVSVVAALGLVFSRRAVYSALMLGVVMLSLAVLYAVQDAPFLAAVQIIVYTGAVMMLFLFVLMLVGVDSSDSLVETIRGQRFWAIVAGLAFAALLAFGIGNAFVAAPKGLTAATQGGNVPSLAQLIFTRHVFAFEVTSALLITAALGAMVLAHRERTAPKATQRDLSRQRFVAFGRTGKNPAPLPGPGTYARHNAIDMPALLPDGGVSPLSVNRYIARHEAEEGTLPPEIARVLEQDDLERRSNGHSTPTLAEDARSGPDTEPLIEDEDDEAAPHDQPDEAVTAGRIAPRPRSEEDGK
ncbi:NADH-quinone oxidoreductase subunit J [Microbispora sp. ATCC PTA-5024]|uniref:NADH-quinone oxidoreductase subunit J n=1 Tax=Microbispora sp. ATCC PTA-5024 TaxID=316330 RepID=UPI0003DDF091|nr:NADH-quinone oxidoreductase subunit J [Microbispora sp. ATCC PTA-5024]ETK34396.1 NADH:ubiquinone oxidoreductase subunit J [Microbispora sp. ATCC PTA-5024]